MRLDPRSGDRSYTADGQDLREWYDGASEPVDRQAVPTGSEAHRTKPRIMPASGIPGSLHLPLAERQRRNR